MSLQVKRNIKIAGYAIKIPLHPPLKKGEIRLSLLVSSFFKGVLERIFKKHGALPAERL
jgi:hypothetical protein